jgi:hypothetical protein
MTAFAAEEPVARVMAAHAFDRTEHVKLAARTSTKHGMLIATIIPCDWG